MQAPWVSWYEMGIAYKNWLPYWEALPFFCFHEMLFEGLSFLSTLCSRCLFRCSASLKKQILEVQMAFFLEDHMEIRCNLFGRRVLNQPDDRHPVSSHVIP